MNDNLEVNAVRLKHDDCEDKNLHYNNGLLYSIRIRGVFFSHFFSLLDVLQKPGVDYKEWAKDIIRQEIKERFRIKIEELEDIDFKQGSLEFMNEIDKSFIKKLDFNEIHNLAWITVAK
jgi:hypothetical protein